jgi:hypothetical protein
VDHRTGGNRYDPPLDPVLADLLFKLDRFLFQDAVIEVGFRFPG